MTAKFSKAIEIVLKNTAFKIKHPDIEQNQEELYRLLEDDGYIWNAGQQEWVDVSDTPPDLPSELWRVRCWAAAEIIEELADLVEASLKQHLTLVERSRVYPCRPPKQLEARVYLSFIKKEK